MKNNAQKYAVKVCLTRPDPIRGWTRFVSISALLEDYIKFDKMNARVGDSTVE